jgi:formyl-CoA transferase
VSRLPLDDLRVIDLTAARAGPQCVRQLADWGADVIRVEPPTRRPSDMGDRRNSDFQNLHRNKRSLTLDLKSERGRAVFLRLAETADVVVENMRPAVKHRLGVDYDAVRAVNPRAVYASISAFGQDGPGSQRGGVDQIAQGMGGLMSVTGEPDGEPTRAGYAVTDLAAGLHAAVGILVALHERERTGEGRWVRTSLLEAAIGLLDFQAARYTVDGVVAPRVGNHHPTLVPMGCFATADGHVNIAAIDGRIWTELARVLDLPELLSDPRFADIDARASHRAELNELVGARLLTRTTAEWIAALEAAGVPAGPVNDVAEVFADPQVHHLAIDQPVQHPELGELRLIANPATLAGVPRRLRSAAPAAGEHNEEILAELGLTAADAEGAL